MMTHAPAAPADTPAAPAPATAVPDAGVAGLFSDELAQLLPEESGGDDTDALSPEALAMLLSAMVDTPLPAGSVATRTAPAGGPLRQPAMRGAGAASPAPDVQAALDGMLDELRSGSLAEVRVLANQAPDAQATAVAVASAAASAPSADMLAGALAIGEPGSALRTIVPPPPARHEVPMHAAVGSADWGRELASRVVTIATDGLHSASVRLSPEHLGPLDIRIAVRDGEASVAFAASHADTRAALEQALPRLRELLAAQGLHLADASVSEHPARQERAPVGASRAAADPAAEPPLDPVRHAPLARGLLDLYA